MARHFRWGGMESTASLDRFEAKFSFAFFKGS
jgi:hypothetical protein